MLESTDLLRDFFDNSFSGRELCRENLQCHRIAQPASDKRLRHGSDKLRREYFATSLREEILDGFVVKLGGDLEE